MLVKLFQADLHTALFYFSGHGCISATGGMLVTPDFEHYDEGISMDEVLLLANQSKIKDKIIIIDCCHAGGVGIPSITGGTSIYLSEGTVILTAARQNESALEVGGHGIFTSLLVGALNGSGADISGNITVGSVYRYIDNVLSFWDQRPQFRANLNYFITLRNVRPLIPLSDLRALTECFPQPESIIDLDPSYEFTSASADNTNVALFKQLQKFQSIGLVRPLDSEHMYFAAMESKSCSLTFLGKQYWKLVKSKKI